MILPFLLLFTFILRATALQITLPAQTQVNQPTRVNWSLDPGDEKQWDFRFVKEGWDVGLAAANVVAGNRQSGEVDVTFKQTGDFVIVAVAGPELDVIGQSLNIQVFAATSSSRYTPRSHSHSRREAQADQSPFGSTSSASVSVSTSTVFTSATSSPASTTLAKKPNVNTTAIVGAILGVLLLILLIIILIIFFRRRNTQDKNKPGRRFTFHRSWLVRAPPPAPQPQMSQTTINGPRPPPPLRAQAPPIRTDRQQMLDDRVIELLEEISRLPGTPRGGRRFSDRLGEIRRKIRWCREVKDSPWARGESDERPEGWESVMGDV